MFIVRPWFSALHGRLLLPVIAGILTTVAMLMVAVKGRSYWLTQRSGFVLQVSGNIEAHQSALGFELVQGRIVSLSFEEGQWVEKGTVLARLNDADYRQHVAEAQAALIVQERTLAEAQQSFVSAQHSVAADNADLAQKQSDFNRFAMLYSGGVIGARDYDLARTAMLQTKAIRLRDWAVQQARARAIATAQANIKYAREQLERAKILLNDTVLRAPFSGVLVTRDAEVGEVVAPGTPVVTLADLDHVWLRAYVSETELQNVHHGDIASVKTDGSHGWRYRGRVSFISSQAEFTPKSVETSVERVSLVYRIKIDLDNPRHELKPGMPADAGLPAQADLRQ